MSEQSESNASNCSDWVWKHSGEPVNVVEECGDRIYYKIEAIKFQDKREFKKKPKPKNAKAHSSTERK